MTGSRFIQVLPHVRQRTDYAEKNDHAWIRPLNSRGTRGSRTENIKITLALRRTPRWSESRERVKTIIRQSKKRAPHPMALGQLVDPNLCEPAAPCPPFHFLHFKLHQDNAMLSAGRAIADFEEYDEVQPTAYFQKWHHPGCLPHCVVGR